MNYNGGYAIILDFAGSEQPVYPGISNLLYENQVLNVLS